MPICDRFEIGERQSGYRCVALSTFSQFTDSVLLHIRLSPRRGRHDSAAQFFCALCRKAPANLSIRYNLSSQVLSVISRLTGCATRASPRGPSLALRAIHLVSRLRRLSGLCGSNVSGTANRLRKTRKKKSSAVPLFEAVAGLWSAPD